MTRLMEFRNFEKTGRNRDFVTATLMTGLIFGVCHYFDAFEEIYALTRQYEEWELDEFALLLLSFPFPIAWFAYRRSQEAVRETTHRMELERALAHSRKLESLGTLASGLAHELNNQLLPVTTLAELMRDRMHESDPDRRKMELIVNGAGNARKTVSKITIFSRIPEDTSVVCEVLEVCRTTEEVLRATCPTSAQLNFKIEGRIGTVDIGEGDLQAIIVNLFSNALDALADKPGDISVTVSAVGLNAMSATRQLPAGNYAKIAVRDTGIGMKPDVCERIFDPFFTTKVVGQGVGLGLAVASQEIRRAGGDILVESEPGQGSEFTIYLPLIDDGGSREQDMQAATRIATQER